MSEVPARLRQLGVDGRRRKFGRGLTERIRSGDLRHHGLGAGSASTQLRARGIDTTTYELMEDMTNQDLSDPTVQQLVLHAILAGDARRTQAPSALRARHKRACRRASMKAGRASIGKSHTGRFGAILIRLSTRRIEPVSQSFA